MFSGILQKHLFRCCKNIVNTSILGLQEKENIVNSVVLSLEGAKNIANYNVLGTFLNASFRTRQAKNIVKYSVFVVSLSLSSIFALPLAAKTS